MCGVVGINNIIHSADYHLGSKGKWVSLPYRYFYCYSNQCLHGNHDYKVLGDLCYPSLCHKCVPIVSAVVVPASNFFPGALLNFQSVYTLWTDTQHIQSLFVIPLTFQVAHMQEDSMLIAEWAARSSKTTLQFQPILCSHLLHSYIL